MVVQPPCKGAVLLPEQQDGFRIFDGGIDLEPVSYNAGILQQPFSVLVGIGGYFGNAEIAVGLPEGCFFFQDGFPAQAGLVDLHKQATEQLIVIMDRKAVMVIVVVLMQGFSCFGLHGAYKGTVGHRFCGKNREIIL